MKNIAKALGVKQTSTEEELVQAIEGLLGKSANQEQQISEQHLLLADKDKEIAEQEQALEKSAADLKEAKEATDEKGVALVAANAKIEELSAEVQRLSELSGKKKIDKLPQSELKKVANHIMSTHKIKEVFVVCDGTPFSNKNDAAHYATNNKLLVHDFKAS
ncbi:MAG: hypothetical protein R2800_09860 [Flavipsychrobacter sp.]